MKTKAVSMIVALAAAVALTTGMAYAVTLGDPDVTINGVTTMNGNVNLLGPTTNVLRVNGKIGLGTGTPSQRLHLFSGSATSMRFRIQNGEGFADFATDGGKLQMFVNDVPRMTIDNTGKVGVGTDTPTTMLDIAGEAKVTVLNITGGSDLSEQFNIQAAEDSKVEPGMVVSIDPDHAGALRVTSKAYDHQVAGIVSGAGKLNTGLVMGQNGTLASGGHPVALTGRVYCYATASNGAIQPGDLLTTSETPGHAMKVGDHQLAQGAILGKAMSGLDKGTGLVLVLVSLQ